MNHFDQNMNFEQSECVDLTVLHLEGLDFCVFWMDFCFASLYVFYVFTRSDTTYVFYFFRYSVPNTQYERSAFYDFDLGRFH